MPRNLKLTGIYGGFYREPASRKEKAKDPKVADGRKKTPKCDADLPKLKNSRTAEKPNSRSAKKGQFREEIVFDAAEAGYRIMGR